MTKRALAVFCLSIWGLAFQAGRGQSIIPEVLSIGKEERIGASGRLSSIATDSLDQPHVVCDGSSYAYMYDKVGGAWRSSSYNMRNIRSDQYYNPHLEIDPADRGWCSGILMGTQKGLGIIVRTDMSTEPSGPYVSPVRIQGEWDSGNLSLDPGQPSQMVCMSARGFWQRYEYDATAATRIRLLGTGQMYAGDGGEKNVFWISKAGNVLHPGNVRQAIWHAAIGGWDNWDSSYQNSLRRAEGRSTVPWAAYRSYPKMSDDGTYVSLVSDNLNPRVAYMASDFGTGRGVCMNVFDGNQMVFPITSILAIDVNGTSGLRRFAPQLAPAGKGGAWITWTRSNRIKLRYVAPDGITGPEVDVCEGALSGICTDSDGNVHIAYRASNAVGYRKIIVSGTSQPSYSTFAGDYDGSGRANIVVYRPSDGKWYILNENGTARIVQWGAPDDVPIGGDFDGDGRFDIAVFRPENGTWYISNSGGGSQVIHWGAEDDIPVAADYNGDGRAQAAVYRPDTYEWFIHGQQTVAWGIEGDIPAPADYDGDGKTDICIFRPSNANWIYWSSRDQKVVTVQWGAPEDTLVPADYDGDNKADVAVYRPAEGKWYYWSSLQQKPVSVQWGAPSDVPVPGKYDGDNRADIGIFRPNTSQWYIQRSTDGKVKGLPPFRWGAAGDKPVPGAYKIPGQADIAVFRPHNGRWYAHNVGEFQWGAPTDIPVVADFTGDRIDEIAVFRPSNGTWYYWDRIAGTTRAIQWGAPSDTPVAADYNLDGKADIAVFRPSNGTWYVAGVGNTQWGAPGDKPVPGHYRGPTLFDVGVFRPSNGNWYVPGLAVRNWGGPSDLPAPADYDYDGIADSAIYRPSTGTFHIWGSTKGPMTAAMGGVGYVPVCRDYDGDGRVDLAVFQSASGSWWIKGSRTGEYFEMPGPIGWGISNDAPMGGRYRVEYPTFD